MNSFILIQYIFAVFIRIYSHVSFTCKENLICVYKNCSYNPKMHHNCKMHLQNGSWCRPYIFIGFVSGKLQRMNWGNILQNQTTMKTSLLNFQNPLFQHDEKKDGMPMRLTSFSNSLNGRRFNKTFLGLWKREIKHYMFDML